MFCYSVGRPASLNSMEHKNNADHLLVVYLNRNEKTKVLDSLNKEVFQNFSRKERKLSSNTLNILWLLNVGLLPVDGKPAVYIN